MKKKDFRKQYLSKEWYELSKKIKARDKNTCQMCGRNDRPVSVHHLIYHEGHKVWEYNDEELICICDRCHEIVSENSKDLYNNFLLLKNTLRTFGFSDNVLSGIISHLLSLFENFVDYGEIPTSDDKAFLFLQDVIRSTQDFNDLEKLERLGSDDGDFIKYLYPELYKNGSLKK